MCCGSFFILFGEDGPADQGGLAKVSFRAKADEIAAAARTPILPSAKRDAQICDKPGAVVFTRPGTEIEAQAFRALCVGHFRQQPNADKKPVLTIAAAERVDAEEGATPFRNLLDAGTANMVTAAMFALKRRTLHVARASLAVRRAAAYSAW